MAHTINWFEIPAKNFERACTFYSSVLVKEVPTMDTGMGPTYGFLRGNSPQEIGGGIVKGEGYEPSASGSIIYLNGGDDLNVPLGKVEKAGGKVLLPKTSLGEMGFMALFLDTEGNKVGFHSMK
jgi:predicted enzyme related to lactoylglutathione lyase